jgi:GNAT superfamily N-acetyltransferase
VPDMLVKLYTLPDLAPDLARQTAAGITLRRAMAPEKHLVVAWVRANFSADWASEADVAINGRPPTCFVATQEEKLIGFACYDSTAKGFFGPTGVAEEARGQGTGRALLLACLHAMRADGYGYGIIGAAGPTGFYTKAVGATPIPDSWPGAYSGLLYDPPGV